MNSPSDTATRIFKKGSTTFFYSSIFFPKSIRAKVFDLYAFVRTADDFVDQIPPDKNSYYTFKKDFKDELMGKNTNNQLAKRFAKLSKDMNVDHSWIEDFFTSMEMDLEKHSYNTISDTLTYIHGSAEIIGLYMSRIMEVPKNAEKYAILLGRAFQFINFIRDIDEDNALNRRYFPKDELEKYQLKNLEYKYILSHRANFNRFIRAQIKQYRQWTQAASKGFKHIPLRYRIPIQTASKMYLWTAQIIYDDPLMVYCHKIKPSRWRVIKQIFLEAATLKISKN